MKFLLIEKKYLKHENSLIIQNLKNNNNVIHDIHGRSLRSYKDELLYDDFIEFIFNYIDKETLYTNNYFSIYEIKY